MLIQELLFYLCFFDCGVSKILGKAVAVAGQGVAAYCVQPPSSRQLRAAEVFNPSSRSNLQFYACDAQAPKQSDWSSRKKSPIGLQFKLLSEN
jgi:hypothetical protein